jgi:hypothetical protein
MVRRLACAILALAAGFLSLSVGLTASASTAPAAPAAAKCAVVKYAHVLVLTSGDVKLAGQGGTVTGQYGAWHGAGAGYGGYDLPAGARHALSFAAAPLVCLTATPTTTALSPSSLAALKTAVDKGPYNFYGIILNKAGSITRIDQLPYLAMSGDWEGTYGCSQGLTGLDLRVVATASGKLTAYFDFYPVTSNPTVPSGSFSMSGSYNAKGVTLTPVKWLVAPAGYETVGLSGFTPGFKGVNTFRGSITVSGCASFLLHRPVVAPDEAAAAGKWKGTYACAQGVSGLTLTIKPGKTVDTTMHALTATFAFYPVKGNPGAPSGSYSMKGYYFPGGIDLQPGLWISKPSVYGMDAVVAVSPAAGGKKLKGVVVTCTGSIDLAKSLYGIEPAVAVRLLEARVRHSVQRDGGSRRHRRHDEQFAVAAGRCLGGPARAGRWVRERRRHATGVDGGGAASGRAAAGAALPVRRDRDADAHIAARVERAAVGQRRAGGGRVGGPTRRCGAARGGGLGDLAVR